MYYRGSFPSPFPVMCYTDVHLFPMPFAVPFGLSMSAPYDLESHFWWPNTKWSPLLSDLNTPFRPWHLRMYVLAVKEHEVMVCWINSLERCRAADGAMTQTINPLLHARTSAEIQQDRATRWHRMERAPAFRQSAEEPETFPLILHGHQNTLRSPDSTIFIATLSRKENSVIIMFQTRMTFFCEAQKGKTLRKGYFS